LPVHLIAIIDAFTLTQIQLERVIATRLADFDFFKLDCVCCKASDRAVLLMLTDGAKPSKKLKWETLLA
jgi:hypothetical protein